MALRVYPEGEPLSKGGFRRAITLSAVLFLSMAPALADDGLDEADCLDCGPTFPDAADVLAVHGYPEDQYEVLISWEETARGSSGERVAGCHVLDKASGGTIDLYYDFLGDLLDELRLAELGICPKNWNPPPVTQRAETPLMPKRAVRPVPKPLGPAKGLAPAGRIEWPELDVARLLAEDEQDALGMTKRPRRIGVVREAPDTIQVAGAEAGPGAWSTLPDGTRLWALAIASPDARAIRVHFEHIALPGGAEVMVYNAADPGEAYGPWARPEGEGPGFWAPSCFSDTVVVECRVAPGAALDAVRFAIDKIVHTYADMGRRPWTPAAEADETAPGEAEPLAAVPRAAKDGVPQLVFDKEVYRASEGSGNVTVRLFLSSIPSTTISVDYATSSGTAQEGLDFIATSGSLYFDGSVTSQQIPLVFRMDSVFEEDETFFLTLSNPGGCLLPEQNPVTIVIENDDCERDIACFDDWRPVGRGVAAYSFVFNQYQLHCTGALLADTDPETDIPYFLTAAHCFSGARTPDSMEFFWLYEAAECTGMSPALSEVPRTSGGADLLVSSAVTDAYLVRIRLPENAPPLEYPHLGWTTNGIPLGSGVVGIHHPSGNARRISFGGLTNTGSPDLGGLPVKPPSLFYEVVWDLGTTERGSSGSPLILEDSQLVIGQLFGGFASCAKADEPDYFGRFEKSYPLFAPWIAPNLVVYDEMDVDKSGSVDSVDIQLVINAALGLPGTCNCDVNNSGAVDAVDVQLVIIGVLDSTP